VTTTPKKEKQQVTRAVSSQDWKDIDKKLNHFYGQVKLICDGYEVTFMLQRRNQFHNVISLYVNGEIQGKWYIEDCEERRRFFRPRTKAFYSKKEIANFRKISKKLGKEMAAKNEYTYYESHWTSFRSLKSHLMKHNKVIHLVVSDL
jgi:hypothetical protein